ncbi:hypothetical protein BABINDRAFT_108681 [Babjeviella inositovora NRRL Y-12698]|uniref:Rad60/SUMO-like domain-containing protein n=1 Tax=Babjeviella inositovora NRRL Y-12698 TaxID=984486 RepID=A0A1E3QV44_9ASCO|nr:uncharacterized protein BABINDRAFT_108681 [Babjeviella inositovora NRRL Y-12698]ODQ81543.1 hypothetical protein BABINDRAFT_108681 [Babjeviella inositovora NRRL Y-12698]
MEMSVNEQVDAPMVSNITKVSDIPATPISNGLGLGRLIVDLQPLADQSEAISTGSSPISVNSVPDISVEAVPLVESVPIDAEQLPSQPITTQSEAIPARLEPVSAQAIPVIAQQGAFHSKPVPHAETPAQPLASIEDDFFSLAYNFTLSLPPEVPKKKKKKKKAKIEPVVVLDEMDEPSVSLDKDQVVAPIPSRAEKATLKRSITPPPAQFTYTKKARAPVRPELELFDVDLPPVVLPVTVPTSYIDRETEKRREYVVDIKSKLPGSQDLSIKMCVKGMTKFSKVIFTALSSFCRLAPSELHGIYALNLVELIWIEQKMAVKAHMKPATLSIPVETEKPHLTFLLIESWALPTFREFPEIANKLKFTKLFASMNESLVEVEQDLSDEDLPEFGDEPTGVLGESADEGYFPIVMKSQDNTTLKVKVSADTLISKLVRHYITIKKLPAGTAVLLVFDDEELEMGICVGDTELEEDFTVDVICK